MDFDLWVCVIAAAVAIVIVIVGQYARTVRRGNVLLQESSESHDSQDSQDLSQSTRRYLVKFDKDHRRDAYNWISTFIENGRSCAIQSFPVPGPDRVTLTLTDAALDDLRSSGWASEIVEWPDVVQSM